MQDAHCDKYSKNIHFEKVQIKEKKVLKQMRREKMFQDLEFLDYLNDIIQQGMFLLIL